MCAAMALCRPLDRPASWIARRRRSRPPAGIVRLNAPVISVGNLTVGGTGKTPTVERLAELLRSRGRRVGVVMAGYRAEKRSPDGWTLVSDGSRLLADVAFAGDEAAMFARAHPSVPLAVGRRKAFVAERLASTVPLDCLVVDDGFQHRRLHRDADIVLLDARAPFGDGRVLPAGRLREPPDALRDADIIILTHAERAHDLTAAYRAVSSAGTRAEIVVSRHVPSALRDSATSDILPPSALRGREVVAVCGIGSPSGFVEMLRGLGATVSDVCAFPDHHRYSRRDLLELRRLANRHALVTTAKDAVKWQNGDAFPHLTLDIRVEWDSDEPMNAALTALGL